MRSVICPVGLLAALPLLAAEPLSPAETARRVAEVEARLPWVLGATSGRVRGCFVRF